MQENWKNSYELKDFRFNERRSIVSG